MEQDTEEFQAAGSLAAEIVKATIRGLSDTDGQTQRSALSGTAAALTELAIEYRPQGMSANEAAMRLMAMVAQYCGQFVPKEDRNLSEMVSAVDGMNDAIRVVPVEPSNAQDWDGKEVTFAGGQTVRYEVNNNKKKDLN